MFNRTNGRKSDTLEATFSYPESSKVSTARVESSGRTALITDQVEIKGTLAFDGPLEFNGIFEGEIISQGTLTIGPEAVIKAEIHAAKVIIRGKVQGNITATESIEVCDNAQLFGDVRTNKFIVAEAALFRGRSDPIEGKADSPSSRRPSAASPNRNNLAVRRPRAGPGHLAYHSSWREGPGPILFSAFRFSNLQLPFTFTFTFTNNPACPLSPSTSLRSPSRSRSRISSPLLN